MNPKVWEWVSSLIAGSASGWFVQDITSHISLRHLYNVIPPTQGPTEIIGFAVIIWLYAKYQRYLQTLPAPALTANL